MAATAPTAPPDPASAAPPADVPALELRALRHLRLTPLIVTLRTRAPWHGPALKGLLLRSALGFHLRQRECRTGAPVCTGCDHLRHCWYSLAFETPPVEPEPRLPHGDSRLPHPFYFAAAPILDRALPAGTELPCLLTLFGEPEPLAGKLLAALSDAGASGRWGGAFGLDWPLSPLVREALPAVAAAPYWQPRWHDRVCAVRVKFVSPLRLRIKGEVQRKPAFEDLARALLRRLHLLAALYSHVDLERGWANPLLDLARSVNVEDARWEYVRESRRSGRQLREVPMDGVVGEMTVSGELARLWPFLEAGQWTGVGASTSHGLGCYSLEWA